MISDVYVRLNRYLLDLSISATREKKREQQRLSFLFSVQTTISSVGEEDGGRGEVGWGGGRESLSPPTDDVLTM